MGIEKFSISRQEQEQKKEEEIVQATNIGKHKSKYGDYYLSDVERLIMGERIPESQRKIFASLKTTSDWDTGSIGFLDFEQRGEDISVGVMGVEHEYQGKGFGGKLIETIESIAEQRDIKKIEFIAVEEKNLPMINLLQKRGYRPIKGTNPEIFLKEFKK